MKSPAQRHFERVSAAKAAALSGPGETLAHASQYELMLMKLHTDRRRLKSIQSIQQKIVVKAEVLPEYADYIAGALEGGRGGQDDVLVTIMVWRIDAGDYAGALEIARYALKYRLTLPDQYERSLSAVLVEMFAEAALEPRDKPDNAPDKASGSESAHEFDHGLGQAGEGSWITCDQLEEIAHLTEGGDMHDQVRAKLYKALGYATLEQPEVALGHLRRALKLNERVGVKKDIERLEKLLKASGESDNAARP